MTKTKQAIKEANKMADKAIIKAKFDAYKAATKEWLDVSVGGYQRKHILLGALIIVAVVLGS